MTMREMIQELEDARRGLNDKYVVVAVCEDCGLPLWEKRERAEFLPLVYRLKCNRHIRASASPLVMPGRAFAMRSALNNLYVVEENGVPK